LRSMAHNEKTDDDSKCRIRDRFQPAKELHLYSTPVFVLAMSAESIGAGRPVSSNSMDTCGAPHGSSTFVARTLG
jgi:hypothetical protein